MEEQPKEKFEQKIIAEFSRLNGKPIDYIPDTLEEHAQVLPPHTVLVNPQIIDNYATTQQAAEKLNKQTGTNTYVGCTCGRLHERDPKTGAIDTGWY